MFLKSVARCRGGLTALILLAIILCGQHPSVLRAQVTQPAATVPTITIDLAESQAVAGQEITTPVWIEDASRLETLQFDLVYDNGALEFKGITVGSMTETNGLVTVAVSSPGRASIQFTSKRPVEGDGELLRAKFLVRADATYAAHKLDVQNVRAQRIARHDSGDAPLLAAVPVNVDPGEVRVVDPPVPLWVLLSVATAIGATLWFGRRRNPALATDQSTPR
ncbi:hypothetical protein BH09PLA1_BH09PLA1_20140 [soil metagenome]